MPKSARQIAEQLWDDTTKAVIAKPPGKLTRAQLRKVFAGLRDQMLPQWERAIERKLSGGMAARVESLKLLDKITVVDNWRHTHGFRVVGFADDPMLPWRRIVRLTDGAKLSYNTSEDRFVPPLRIQSRWNTDDLVSELYVAPNSVAAATSQISSVAGSVGLFSDGEWQRVANPQRLELPDVWAMTWTVSSSPADDEPEEDAIAEIRSGLLAMRKLALPSDVRAKFWMDTIDEHAILYAEVGLK